MKVGLMKRAAPVTVIQWQLAPHAVLPAHNHSPYYVFSLCLEGECRVDHYEIRGAAPAPGTEGHFVMRATHSRLLRPGTGTSLTQVRDNIHTFRAGPAGALGIDLNFAVPKEGDWSMIEHRPAEGGGFDRFRDARWIGKPE